MQAMNPPSDTTGGWRILRWHIFSGLSFFEILGGEGYPLGGLYLLEGTWYFLAHKVLNKQLTFYFLYI